MKKTVALLVAFGFALSACGELINDPDKSRDRGTFDRSGDLADLQAGVWVSPQGCEYWIIDDGVEGYLTNRFDPYSGKPVCRDVPQDFPGVATGDFKGGSTSVVGDPI